MARYLCKRRGNDKHHQKQDSNITPFETMRNLWNDMCKVASEPSRCKTSDEMAKSKRVQHDE